MKVTQRFKSVRILFLAVLAVGLSAGVASAQKVEGKFTLPFEARWGRAVLPAGDYTFNVETSTSPYIVMIRHNRNGVAYVMADSVISRGDFSGSSALIAVRSGGKLRIRILRLREVGAIFGYYVPKAERQFIAQAPELLQRIPVSVQGK